VTVRTPTLRPRRWVVAGAVLAAITGTALGAAWFASRRLSDPDRLWVEAENAFRAGRRREARDTLRAIERLRPRKAVDWLLEAQLASADGRTDDALAAIGQVPKGDPMFGQAELMAGRLERERNRLRAAESHFRKALEFEPRIVEAHKELIYIYGVQSRRRDADAEFRALARLTRLTHHDLFTWALTHFTSWNPDVARDLQAFVDADPGDRQSRLALADILLDQQGQGERVLKILDVLPPGDPEALALRVGLALHQGRLDDARALLERGPKDHPGLSRFRGRLALAANDPATAVEHFKAALSFEPYDRVSTFEFGQALALKGDKAAAEPLLARARRLNDLYNLVVRVRSPDRENLPPDLVKLGAACEASGLVEEANHWYTLAVTRDPLDVKAQQGLYRFKPPDKRE
jgi:tetratricopeptide (TPR) repeat protein